MKTVELVFDDYENGEEIKLQVPCRMEVCDRCEGHGTHLTPSIGEHAYTLEEFYEEFPEDEDREQYFQRGGMYDVECETCKGKNVVAVPDMDQLWAKDRLESGRLKAIYKDYLEKQREWAAERRAEERCGY